MRHTPDNDEPTDNYDDEISNTDRGDDIREARRHPDPDGTELEIKSRTNVRRILPPDNDRRKFPRYVGTFVPDVRDAIEAVRSTGGTVRVDGKVDAAAFDCTGMGCRVLDARGDGIRLKFPVINPDADLADDAVDFLLNVGER